MADNKDGGPAFPRTTEQVSNRTDAADYQHFGEAGMTLRDYFAAKALYPAFSELTRRVGEADNPRRHRGDPVARIRTEDD